MNVLINQAIREYQEKLQSLNADNLLEITTYGLILTYLQKEPLSEKYIKILKCQDNILDYLYRVCLREMRLHYRDIRDILNDEQAYLSK